MLKDSSWSPRRSRAYSDTIGKTHLDNLMSMMEVLSKSNQIKEVEIFKSQVSPSI